MVKENPNRQQLIDFINQKCDNVDQKITKIEDLSNGVHYLHLLHKLHPKIVKLGKVNLKAFHEHQNITNLKLLAQYLSDVKAPFTVQVQKIALRNYQLNLNLLKNLYKYYYLTINQENQSSLVNNVNKSDAEEKKNNKPKIIVKPPQNIHKLTQIKKQKPKNDALRHVAQQTQEYAKKVQSIMTVVKSGRQPEDKDAAEEKLKKIKQILGLQIASPHTQTKQLSILSNKCSDSKSQFREKADFQKLELSKCQKLELPKTQNKKNTNSFIQGSQTDPKNHLKSFDCDQIRQNMLKKYDLRLNQGKKNESLPIQGTQDKEKRFSQNLLSPQAKSVGKNNLRETSKRKNQSRMSEKNIHEQVQKIKPTTYKKSIKTMSSCAVICQQSDEDSTKKGLDNGSKNLITAIAKDLQIKQNNEETQQNAETNTDIEI